MASGLLAQASQHCESPVEALGAPRESLGVIDKSERRVPLAAREHAGRPPTALQRANVEAGIAAGPGKAQLKAVGLQPGQEAAFGLDDASADDSQP